MKGRGISLILLFLSQLVMARQGITDGQVNRYFIYFKDKGAENYPYSVADPQAFLSQRSIDRKKKQNIPITHTDLPVPPTYVQALSEAKVNVFFTSRWLNGALVHADTTLINKIETLDFVDSVALIAESSVLSSYDSQPLSPPITFDPPVSVSGDSDVQLSMIGAFLMHQENIKGQGMRIAVFDNGFEGVDTYTPFQHVWEDNRILATKDFVRNSGNIFQYGDHGTSVFSTLSSSYYSEQGDLVGIAPEAEYILCVTEETGSEDRVEEYNWLLAAEYADSLGVDVINASLGYNTFDIAAHNYSKEALDGHTAIISYAASMAARKGMIVVTSAGNSGRRTPPANLISHPADASGILSVGSATMAFERSGFSSIGPTADGRTKPEVAAFGDATTVLRGNGKISRTSGTSFAAPLIAGFAACIWQLNPERTAGEVITTIKNSGHLNNKINNELGWGVPNYAYVKHDRVLKVSDILEDRVLFYPNPFQEDMLHLITEGEGAFEEGMSIRIVDPKGNMVYNQSFAPEEIEEEMELQMDSSQTGVYFLFLQTGDDQKIVKLLVL